MNLSLKRWVITNRWTFIVASALLLILPLLAIASLWHKGLTADEASHYSYGYRVRLGVSQRVAVWDDSKMPISQINVIGSEALGKLGQFLGVSSDQSALGQIKRGRYTTIALSLLLAWYVFTWSYELYGRNAALLSLTLYVFDPNLLAHGQLVTTDLPAALMTTMALYHFWRFLKLGGRGRALLSAITLGLSQLAKYSCVYLYPIFIVLAVFYQFSAATGEPAKRDAKPRSSVLARWSAAFVFFTVVSVLVIDLGFAFDGVGTPLAKCSLDDPFFKEFQTLPFVGELPLPLPAAYIQGLDMIKSHDRTGLVAGNLYMAGRLLVNPHDETFHGFPGYFFYAAFFKVPIATQILFASALLGFCWRRGSNGKRYLLWRDEAFLLIPIAVYWVYFNFFFNTQIGIRYVLPVFALAIVFCGRFLVESASNARRWMAALLALWVAASTVSYYPHFISYFNEFVWDRRLAYRHLADSNLDWGGNEWYLAEYIRQHPAIALNPDKSQTGRIVVTANHLVGLYGDGDRFRWLRERFTPVDHIAYSYLVFDVPPDITSPAGR